MARYALVVGISEYRNPLPPLTKPATDAQSVAALLQQSGGFQEITLLVGTVTGKQLGQALQRVLLEQAAKNEALIYFTGHGITATGSLGHPRGVLATSDCEVERQDNQVIVSRSIALDELNDLIRESDLSNLVVLLDCCHGEYALERGLVERLTAFSINKDYYFITACRSFEEARAKKSEAHSVFTGALLTALSYVNADAITGIVSGDRLFDYLSRELKGSGQEPIRLGWGRSIPILQYPVTTPISPEIVHFRRDNPYVGLASFDITQAAYFYGRERAVRDLLDRLNKGHFLVVYGPSGCGKSSLIKAGLLPQLQSDRLPGSSQWHLELCTPCQTPLQTLLDILPRQYQHNQPFLLFVDQFEELFTLCQDAAEQQQFIHLLSEAINHPNARILIAIRGDFLDRCTQFPEVVTLINSTDPPSTYLVTPLTLAELEDAIAQPAARHGVTYEPGLVSQIAEDVVGQPGELPLLQYALTELWQTCIREGAEPYLTHQGYEQIGRVQGALQRRAHLLYESFSAADQAFVRQLMTELVQLGEGQEVTRRRAEWDQLRVLADSPAQLDRVLGQLVAQRLIVTDAKTVEVAHETLLTEWPLLKKLIEENREVIRLRRHLQSDCQEWQQKGRSQDYLLSAGRLAAIEEWVKRDQPRLPAAETEYVKKSQEKRDQEQQAKLRRERLAWFLTAGLLCSVTVFSLISAQIAKRGEVDTLVKLAENNFTNHQQLEALATSIKALNALKGLFLNQEEYRRRLQTIVYRVQERNRWVAHQEGVSVIDFNHRLNGLSPANALVASVGGKEGKIKLWNMQGKLIESFQNPEKSWRVALSHDGQFIASTGADGKVRVRNIKTKVLTSVFPGHQGGGLNVEFSPDDSLLASSGEDAKIKFWKIKNTGYEHVLPTGFDVRSLDFHPKDKSVIAYGGANPTIKVWNRNNQKTSQIVLGKHSHFIDKVKFNFDGSKLATSGDDGIVKIWSTRSFQTQKLLAEIDENRQVIYALAFSRDGRFLASGGTSGIIRVWDLERVQSIYKVTQRPVKPAVSAPLIEVEGHSQDINSIEFIYFEDLSTLQENDRRILSASDDGTIRLWEWQPDKTNASIKVDDLLKEACIFLQDYLKLNPGDDNQVASICS